MDPEKVARDLTAWFLQKGAFEDLDASEAFGPAATLDFVPAGADHVEIAGIAVRAVGASDYDMDGEKRPTCYVYATRAPRRVASALENEVDGVQIRVRRIGRLQVKPELAAATTAMGHSFRKGRRITCGSSIGLAGERTAGTLGALVATSQGTGPLFCLSNNHVFGGCNHTPTGQPILAPSTIDVRPGSPTVLQFALFHSLDELRSGHINHVPMQRIDAALAEVQDSGLVTSMQGTYYDTPPMARAPRLGERVMKVGRTTDLTVGVVESRVPHLLTLPYKARKFSAVVNYADVWIIRSEDEEPFALEGDSGSLVVSEDRREAVGLLFAANADGERGIITSLPDVLSRFSVRLMSGL